MDNGNIKPLLCVDLVIGAALGIYYDPPEKKVVINIIFVTIVINLEYDVIFW